VISKWEDLMSVSKVLVLFLLDLLTGITVLTTFDLARRDIDILDNLPWTCIMVDEVHRVKNMSAKITKAYHRFTCDRRFGLTGTTIQNSYNEMWTILDWTNPGRLGTDKQWKGFVVKPLTIGQSAGSNEEERTKALVRVSPHAASKIQSLLSLRLLLGS
jgi:SNF2 family DNA or RNA helicase